MLSFSPPPVSPSSTFLVMKIFSSQVEDLINGDKVRTWHTLRFFSGKAFFFLPLPSSLFCSFFPSSSYFTSLSFPLREEAYLSSAFADMAIWTH